MKKNIYLILIAGVFAGTSCKKILDQKPQSSLDATTAYTTKSGVEAGILGIYDGVSGGDYFGLAVWIYADLYADNLSHTGTFPTFAQMTNKQLLPDNVNISSMWNDMYNTINRANNIIESAPKITDPSFNKNAAIAEARTLRGFTYFNLLRFFGGSTDGYNKGTTGQGIPIFTTPTLSPQDATPKPKSTEAEVYALIISDLDFGIANLPATAANGRLTRNAATALKARLQLYREQWADAETLATNVISQFAASANGGLISGANYANLWLSKNQKPESIWELQYFPDDRNFGAFYYYTGATGGRNEITTSASLRNAHEAGDLRLAVNNTTAAPGIPANKTRKFSRVAGDDNIILIRLAELYLIRAEARIRKASPDMVGAISDLNLIRSRAGLPASLAVTTNEILNAILQERRIELAHEGHRFFDLRRYNAISVLGITEPFRALWPIPQRENQTSGDVVKQNPGY